MSTQPIPIAQQSKEQQLQAKLRADFRSDMLYVAGGVLVSIGAGIIRVRYGVISAGAFCLLPPVLELASGFIRGLRVARR